MLFTFAYGKQVVAYRRTWREIARLSRFNLWLIFAWNVLFAAALVVAFAYLTAMVAHRAGVSRAVKLLLAYLFVAYWPARTLLPNIIKFYLFLKGRGYRG